MRVTVLSINMTSYSFRKALQTLHFMLCTKIVRYHFTDRGEKQRNIDRIMINSPSCIPENKYNIICTYSTPTYKCWILLKSIKGFSMSFKKHILFTFALQIVLINEFRSLLPQTPE